jgi:fatty-acyl-CoA synthase
MATGDVRHFNRRGLLFVDGRDDDMIVSGGENVFPSEIEEILLEHPGIAEVCVVGVSDPWCLWELPRNATGKVVRRNLAE